MRRVLSYLLDIAFVAAPWSAIVGIPGLAALGGTIYTSVGSAVLLVMDAAVFLARGRTLGMAVAGLFAANGRKWLALVVHTLFLLFTVLVTFWVQFLLPQADVLTSQTADVLAWLVPPLALFFNLICLVGSQRRTLTDRIAGSHVVRDSNLAGSRTSARRGPNGVDWLTGACIGVPSVLGLAHPPSTSAAIASFTGLVAFTVLDLSLWRKTGATLGARALARSP